MANSNAERQAAWRARRQAENSSLAAENATLRARVAELEKVLRNAKPRPPPPKPEPKVYHFPLLRLDRGFTEAQLNAAYRAAAKRCHPDAGGSNALMVQLTRERDHALPQAKRNTRKQKKAQATGHS